MHLAYIAQFFQCQREIKHRGKFNEHSPRLRHQQFFELTEVGLAIRNGYCLSAVSVSTGRIQINAIHRLHLLKIRHTVLMMNLDIQAQQRKIMPCQISELGLAFYIMRCTETSGKERTIYTETACQIRKTVALNQTGLVECSRFGRTLLHRQMSRIEQIWFRCPRREFSLSNLATCYLRYGKIHINQWIFLGLQCQKANIIARVFLYILKCFG